MNDLSNEFRDLIAAAERVSADTGDIVREVLQAGLDQPLGREEARALLGRVFTVMRERAEARAAVALTGRCTSGPDPRPAPPGAGMRAVIPRRSIPRSIM